MPIPFEHVASAAEHGSPELLHALGRVFGLGQEERRALLEAGFPGWAIFAAGLAGGVWVGTWAHRNWPRKMERYLGMSKGRS